jgi:AraC family transcriptional regulator of adaptative response/methylated-DNA-[protein]-cysteine methyltransferase
MINGALNTRSAATSSEHEDCWQAVLTRDSRFDGRFVFAVQSTGIYCRPSCPARRPQRDRVSFFQIPEAAEQAGFRPCRRCHPRTVKVTDPQVAMVQAVCRYLETNEESSVTLAALGRQFGVSLFHLQRTFKNLMGITPREFADAHRIQRFKQKIRSGDTIARATYDSGFGSSSRIYERADDALGMTPATYGRGGEGAAISYTIVPCSLGQLLVAATIRGVCAVKLGDSVVGLKADLLSEYPKAVIQRDDTTLEKSVADVLDHLDGKTSRLDLPLDLRATAFQRRVWQELRTIPYGETRSYAEVAKALGEPKAVRAVARACATNPVALVVPCHRVIGKDQRLTGYRWGLERKRALLKRESSTELEARKTS